MAKRTVKVDPIQNKLVKAVSENDLKTINALLGKCASVDGPNKYGMTPLVTAVSYSNVEAVKVLLEAGADPNLGIEGYVDYGYKLPTYDTPLHSADWDTDSTVPEIAAKGKAMVELLVAHGAKA